MMSSTAIVIRKLIAIIIVAVIMGNPGIKEISHSNDAIEMSTDAVVAEFFLSLALSRHMDT